VEIAIFPIDPAEAGLPQVPGRLATAPRPPGGVSLAEYLHRMRASGVDVLVSALTAGEERALDLETEAATAAAAGIDFRSAPIPDFGVPKDVVTALAVVDRLGDDLMAGRFVVCHCRGGIGRSSMLAAATLIRLGATPAAALAAITAARGRRVPETGKQRRWLEAVPPKQSRPEPG
jgi:protein-tyrosine phosphatase